MRAQSVGLSIESSDIHKVSQVTSVVEDFMPQCDLVRHKTNNSLRVLFPVTVFGFEVPVVLEGKGSNSGS